MILFRLIPSTPLGRVFLFYDNFKLSCNVLWSLSSGRSGRGFLFKLKNKFTNNIPPGPADATAPPRLGLPRPPKNRFENCVREKFWKINFAKSYIAKIFQFFGPNGNGRWRLFWNAPWFAPKFAPQSFLIIWMYN